MVFQIIYVVLFKKLGKKLADSLLIFRYVGKINYFDDKTGAWLKCLN